MHVRPTIRRGFTLIELLVVIGTIAILMGILFSFLGAMTRVNRLEAGVNTVAVAVAADRAEATKTRATLDPPLPDSENRGTAILFCPNGEIRLLETNQEAQGVDPGDPQRNVHFLQSFAGGSWTGFTDVPRESIKLPSGAGALGILKPASNAADPKTSGPVLVAPPFAIRFNQHGNLVLGDPDVGKGGAHANSDQNLVIYNWNYDRAKPASNAANYFNPFLTRPTNYDSQPYEKSLTNPASVNGQPPPALFQRIEVCVGVVIYAKKDLTAATDPTAGGAPFGTNPLKSPANGYVSPGVVRWLTQIDPGSIANNNTATRFLNSRAMFFSQSTGVAIR